jgi:hypothetical protein
MKPARPRSQKPLERIFIMNRTFTSIAFAAAATLGAASAFAGGMPAAGEFSGVEQVSAPFTAHVHSEPRARYDMAANGQPAAGEFSAADDQLMAAPALSREQVRQALADARTDGVVVANGEAPEAIAPAPSTLTRQQVRQEGRMALRAGQIATGDARM